MKNSIEPAQTPIYNANPLLEFFWKPTCPHISTLPACFTTEFQKPQTQSARRRVL